MEKLKKIRNIVFRYICIYIGINIVLLLILVVGYQLPAKNTIESASEAYEEFLESGIYSPHMDGWTDILIISSTIVSYENSLDHSIGRIGFALQNNVCRGGIELSDPLGGLKELLNDPHDFASYSNYFVVGSVFFRMLFSFFTLDTVRFFMGSIALCGIVIISIMIFEQRKNMKAVIPLLVMVVSIQLIQKAQCLTYGIDIVLMLLSMILVCIIVKKSYQIDWGVYFFILGIITYAMNYWSFPIMTLCGSLTLLFSLRCRYDSGVVMFRRVITGITNWIIGFGSEVLLRLIVSSSLNRDSNTIVEHLKYYSTSDSIFDVGLSRFQRTLECFKLFFTLRNKVLFVVMILIIIPGFIKSVRRIKNRKNLVLGLLTQIIILFIPIVWLFVLYNHTFHGFDNVMLCLLVYQFGAIFTNDYIDNSSDCISEEVCQKVLSANKTILD